MLRQPLRNHPAQCMQFQDCYRHRNIAGVCGSLLWQSKGAMMPAERVAMRQVREIIRLKCSAGISTREIARRLGIAASTARETLRRFEGAGPWSTDPSRAHHTGPHGG